MSLNFRKFIKYATYIAKFYNTLLFYVMLYELSYNNANTHYLFSFNFKSTALGVGGEGDATKEK